ncbi:ParB/RepB/Spo0J family partition protein (plasmid) [Acidovorax sp. DW039]|uniref:ParB/RepB/Spo0J family partition protein n=1 Tax=Acidovorax sp. DW039 TaxID=3095606 RepID=UPI003087B539|nr:ParB/RepB/Spo0J family partition protein [Acidovorax sp. DW039]
MAMTPPKFKVDPTAAMKRLQQSANAAATDRFALASQVMQTQPTGLTVSPPAIDEPKHATSSTFDISRCVPGSIVSVPLHLIDLNELGPRQIYQSTEIDKIAATITEAQDDAAHGYVKDGRVKLIDGGTRVRAAKVSGVDHLDVKFEVEPESTLALYLRARSYNDQRSQPTAIDHAISLRKLIESGAVPNNRVIAEKIPDPNGRPMSESQVSMYMRISRMPDRVLQRMSETPSTAAFTILYAVSELFEKIPDRGQAEDTALSIIDDIRQKDLSKQQVIGLVRSKLEGTKHRERSSQQSLTIGSYEGVVKIFAKRGHLELSMKNLPPDQLPELQRALITRVEDFFKEQQAKSTSSALETEKEDSSQTL